MNLQKNDSTTLEIFPIHFEFSGLPMVHINFVGIVVCCFDFTLTQYITYSMVECATWSEFQCVPKSTNMSKSELRKRHLSKICFFL